MARTTTRIIDFDRFRMRRPSAAVIIKLMMAANDLSYANQSLREYKAAVERGDKNVRRNGGLYWVRLQLAHMSEVFSVIQEIRDDHVLMQVVRSCDLRTQESFAALLPFLHGGPRHAEFVNLVQKVRHNVTFHYQCDKLILKALQTLAERPEFRFSSITRGDDVRQWHFQTADVVLDTIVVRELWQVPLDRPSGEGADEAVLKTHQMFLSLMDFAGEFIWKCCEA
jgi:hypothetical protein